MLPLLARLSATLLLAWFTAGTGRAATAPLAVPEVAARAAHTATTLGDGRVLVAGGCVVDGCGDATESTVLVGEDGRSFVAGPSMSQPRDGHTATVLGDGRVLLAGGYLGEGQPPTQTVDVFDPATDRITPTSPLLERRGGHTAARLGDGRVLVVGGWVGHRTATASVDIWDPATETFVAGPPLPVALEALTAVTLRDGRVLVVGGLRRPEGAWDGALLFDGATDQWVKVGPLAQARFKHALVALPDGRALVIGGTADDQTLLATTEIFDPVAGVFTPGPDLVAGRYKVDGAAVVLADGRVVVAGGGPGIELLDVAARTSVVIADSGWASFSTVSDLGSDRVLVLGGYDREIRLARSAEVVSTRL